MNARTGDVEFDPETPLPSYLRRVSTMADATGLYVLWVSGRCRCGWGDRGIAPSWKVPSENGGGFLTDECLGCLGTVEYDEEWRRVDHAVEKYSDLHPSNIDDVPQEADAA